MHFQKFLRLKHLATVYVDALDKVPSYDGYCRAVFIPLSKDDPKDVVKAPLTTMVCPDCNGSGTELYKGLKGQVFTAEDVEQNREFFEDMAGGSYDVPCSRCGGNRVINTPALEHFTDETLEKYLEVLEDWKAADDHAYWEAVGEQRMGC